MSPLNLVLDLTQIAKFLGKSSLPHWGTQSWWCLWTTPSFVFQYNSRTAMKRFICVTRNTENNNILSVDAAKLSVHSEHGGS